MVSFSLQQVAICAVLVAGQVNGDATLNAPLRRRQLLPVKPSSSLPAVPVASGLPSAGGSTSALPILGGGSDPSSGLPSSVPAVPAVGGASSPLGAVGGALGGLLGGGSAPLGAVTGAVTGLTGGAASPLTGVTNAVSGAASPLTGVTNAVSGAVGSVPVVGSAVAPITNTAGSNTAGSNTAGSNLTPPPFAGIPGTDPVGAFSISVIATLLSLLKKDPMSLFAPAFPIGSLVKRDLPELHRAGIPELARRQLPGLPSLSTGVSGVGIGSLPLSGVPGVPPDLAFLVGSIAKNIAIPGGTGLGSVTNNILTTLNGVVPNFLFQLPVVQDSVPTFGVLQLLASINPSKFRDLASLTSLASLQQAASGIAAGDLSFIKTLPVSPDPSNLISTIMTLSDNILSLPGNVSNLKAAISVLCLKNLGLSVPGL